MLDVRWLSLFADVPVDRVEPAGEFWTAVTGWPAGRPAGRDGEYLPLIPGDGDRYLWLQRVGSPSPGWHLDMHVPDVSSAAAQAQRLGARPVRAVAGLVTMHSPAGQPFCLVAEEQEERRRPAPAAWPSGRSRVDQICLDIPAATFDAECRFWSRLTGWPQHGTLGPHGEFDRLVVPPRFPLRVLLQRLGGDDDGGCRAHADLSADDRAGEVARHRALGGQPALVADDWTTLRDPAGLVYCVTDRRPW